MIPIVAAISTTGFILFIMLGLYQQKLISPHERIKKALSPSPQVLKADYLPIQYRLFKPIVHHLTGLLGRWIPKRHHGDSSRLNGAGLNYQWSSVEWSGLKLGLGILNMLLLIAVFTLLQTDSFTMITLAFIGFFIGYLFPDSWLKSKIRKRRHEIENVLPDTLDLLTVSVEAGLGFDAALLKVVEKQKGALSEEFLRVLQEIKMGRPRRDALRDLGKRNNVDDLNNVIASLVQADQLGISIGEVLRNQSKQIRQKRKQRAEEKAQKAPVKIMVPLVFFIFPFIFIIILGPAVIQIIKMFTQY